MTDILMGGLVLYGEPSLLCKAFSGIILSALVFLGFSEVAGIHLQYSKFANPGQKITLPSKIGMLVFYTPAFLAGISSFLLFPGGDDIRFLILKSTVTIQFLKRDLEVLFVHKFSGSMVVDTAILISLTYFTVAGGMVYFQHTVQNYPEPSMDLKYIGLLLFVVGILGNFYHHLLLAKLRTNSTDKQKYKIPTGGLFGLVTCPHYLFEIITFVGFACISQTLFTYSCAIGSASYLAGRSYTSRKWYISKFENYPKHMKALIPYVF